MREEKEDVMTKKEKIMKQTKLSPHKAHIVRYNNAIRLKKG